MLASLATPFSAFELRDAVRHAQRFDSARLDRVLRLDAGQGLIEAQASASWESLAARLHPSDPAAVEHWSDLGTLGESIATNRPGPDGRPVVAHLESLALVTPDGELKRASRNENAELFFLAVGGQQLFGVLYSATLRLESLAQAGANACAPERLATLAAEAPCRALRLLVPPGALERFLAEARACCAEWRTAIAAVEVRRTHAEAETVLRWARREYAAVELLLCRRETLGASVRATQLARELIDLALSHGGSYPISDTPEATRAQAEACYPELRALLAEKRRIDPCEKLSNAWLRHHRSLLARQACESRWNA